MFNVIKFIEVASLFTAVSLFSQVYSCHYWLIGRLTVNRHVTSFFHSPILLYAVLAFHSVNRCNLYFIQCFLSVYTQYLCLISPIRPISPMQCFYGPPSNVDPSTAICHLTILTCSDRSREGASQLVTRST